MKSAVRICRAVSALLLLGTLSACVVAPPRISIDAEAAAGLQRLDAVRVHADADLEAVATVLDLELRGGVRPTVLSLSGGADGGAYGAGVLAGWSRRGDRPAFDIVVGVSTGALIAPFAFLGSAYDDRLARLYTSIGPSDVFRPALLSGLFGTSFADARPLARLIEDEVTTELLSDVARAHASGRRLLAITTDLEAQRAVVWNLGAIAAWPDPEREALFEAVLLASSSIPVLFPPVLIDAPGLEEPEIHVDGAATTQFFVAPEQVLLASGAREPGAALFILVNGKIAPEPERVPLSSLAIARRSFDTLLKSHTRSSLINAYRFAQGAGVAFRLTHVDEDFPSAPDGRLFDPDYMRALFEHGFERAAAGRAWSPRPLAREASAAR